MKGEMKRGKNKNHFSPRDLAQTCTLRFFKRWEAWIYRGKNAQRRREQKMKRMEMSSEKKREKGGEGRWVRVLE